MQGYVMPTASYGQVPQQVYPGGMQQGMDSVAMGYTPLPIAQMPPQV